MVFAALGIMPEIEEPRALISLRGCEYGRRLSAKVGDGIDSDGCNCLPYIGPA